MKISLIDIKKIKEVVGKTLGPFSPIPYKNISPNSLLAAKSPLELTLRNFTETQTYDDQNEKAGQKTAAVLKKK